MRALASSSLTGHVRVVPAIGRPHFHGASTPQASLLPQWNLLRAIEGLNLARNLKANGGRLLTKNCVSVKAKPSVPLLRIGRYCRSSASRLRVAPTVTPRDGRNVMAM